MVRGAASSGGGWADFRHARRMGGGDMYKLFSLTVLLLLTASGIVRAAQEGDWPTRPIRLVVPFAPGGGVDFVARLIADKLGHTIGQSVVVDNRSGASAIIGTSAVANANPDGYTLLITNINYEVNPVLRKNLPYDTFKQFASVSTVGALPAVLLVPSNSRVRSLNELVALAKREPGNLNYASAGLGSVNFLAAELLKKQLELKITHVPYQGGSPALTSIVSGQTDLLFITVPPAMPFIKDGKVRALVVTSESRVASLPDVPTVAEVGYPGLTMTEVYGIVVPSGTPRPIVERINAAIRSVLGDPAIRDRLQAAGVTPSASTPEQFTSYVHQAIGRWEKVITPEMRTE